MRITRTLTTDPALLLTGLKLITVLLPPIHGGYSSLTMTNNSYTDQCTCDRPLEFRIRLLLIEGLQIRCEACDGVYARLDDERLYEMLAETFSFPVGDELEVRFDGDVK